MTNNGALSVKRHIYEQNICCGM